MVFLSPSLLAIAQVYPSYVHDLRYANFKLVKIGGSTIGEKGNG